jgi:putative endonuclease
MTVDSAPQKAWFVYVIRSDDDQLYTGITTDINRRWREHTTGKAGARYFRGRKPQALCLLETHPDRSSASKREAAIKQLKRREKELLLAQQTSTPLLINEFQKFLDKQIPDFSHEQ